MTTVELILVLLGLAALLLAGFFAWIHLRRQALRRRFGPEYDRIASEMDNLGQAEHELRDREARHAKLELRELSDDTREDYVQQWTSLQARFIDSPETSVGEADALVTRLIADRGYPTGDFDEAAAMLSVEHAQTLADYRTAHEIATRHEAGRADTEELRQAIVHYRTLVADLLGGDPVA
ncbi:hypothetical protein, partial [Allorhizocola rhizosphaerae]|uniref:hypothetical protein n=1 Tax=Allorhizocola rhizosphaerae TaxID=1872709 RepID=UPI000E3C8EDC